MRTTLTDSDIKVLARSIQDESGSKYTESLRAAQGLATLSRKGQLDMMWRIDSGKFSSLNGSLTPYQASTWVPFLEALNSQGVTGTAIWSMHNAAPSINFIELREPDAEWATHIMSVVGQSYADKWGWEPEEVEENLWHMTPVFDSNVILAGVSEITSPEEMIGDDTSMVVSGQQEALSFVKRYFLQ